MIDDDFTLYIAALIATFAAVFAHSTGDEVIAALLAFAAITCAVMGWRGRR